MEELDKMAKLYRELEAAKEGQAREMASLRGLLEEEKVKGQTLDGSRREVSLLYMYMYKLIVALISHCLYG